MTRPDTLYFDHDINGYVLRDYPPTFDLSTIPQYNGTRLDLGVDAEGARFSLMTRVAGYIAEHEQRKATPRNYETYPDNDAGDVNWEAWAWEPLDRLGNADRHLVRHGAIGKTAARYYGGGLEAEAAPAEQSSSVAVAPDETGPLPSSPAPQPPAVKVGDRVLVKMVHQGTGVQGVVEAHVLEVSPSGQFAAASLPHHAATAWFSMNVILEVLPPRTEGANA